MARILGLLGAGNRNPSLTPYKRTTQRSVDGDVQPRPRFKSWLKWAHEHVEVVRGEWERLTTRVASLYVPAPLRAHSPHSSD